VSRAQRNQEQDDQALYIRERELAVKQRFQYSHGRPEKDHECQDKLEGSFDSVQFGELFDKICDMKPPHSNLTAIPSPAITPTTAVPDSTTFAMASGAVDKKCGPTPSQISSSKRTALYRAKHPDRTKTPQLQLLPCSTSRQKQHS
jgi:hypothetical protein